MPKNTQKKTPSIAALRKDVRIKRDNATRAALQAESRLLEAQSVTIQSLVDPRDALYDDDAGEYWIPITGQGRCDGNRNTCYTMEQLDRIRERTRHLADVNEFAINGHENRVSYIAGTGYTYRAVPADDDTRAESRDLVEAVQAEVDRFIDLNDWSNREQEIVRRGDRDGEAFIRKFISSKDQALLVRMVEPECVRPPGSGSMAMTDEDEWSFGIKSAPGDVETVQAYYVDGQSVDAEKIEHIKLNVDRSIKRGVPTFFPVEKNLRRAEKLLRNMSQLAAIQSAFAVIRKHSTGSKAQVEGFADERADLKVEQTVTGRTDRYRRGKGAKIVDVPSGMDYDFPATKIKAAELVGVHQADLRAVAARLVMPEFMFTSDASNANMASSFVAQMPAIKNFERLQAFYRRPFLAIVWDAIRAAVRFGRLDKAALELTDIQAVPPTIVVRKPLENAQANQILRQNKVLSAQTWAQREGLEYHKERINMDEEEDDSGFGGQNVDDVLAATSPAGGSAGADVDNPEDSVDSAGPGAPSGA